MSGGPRRYDELPFIKQGPGGVIESHWSVQHTASWTADNKTGALYAVMLINFMRRKQEPTLLASVCRDICKHGLSTMGGFNGVSVGFFHEISRRAIG